MKTRIPVLMVVALLVAIVAVPVGANASSPPTGKIAFASDRLAIKFVRSGPVCSSASCSDIYVMNADGSGLSRLTPGSLTGFENCPSWSPDGTRLVFERTYKGYQGHTSHQIYEIGGDGSNLTQVTFGTQMSVCPAWSPDGSAIAFVRRAYTPGGPPAYGHIAIMNPDGTGVTEITSGPDFDQRPQWSPDGSQIAFERDVRGCSFFCGSDVYLMNRDGSGLTRLVNGWSPTWSPDGKRIAFWNDQLNVLQVLDLASGSVTTLATAAQVGGDPATWGVALAWSPDGGWIAVGGFGDVSGGAPLVLVSIDGTTVSRVPNGEDAMAPAWHA